MEKLFKSRDYQLTRKDMICKVSIIIHILIEQFMERVLKINDCNHKHNKHRHGKHEEVRQSSLLFNEELYNRSKWTIDIPVNGFASTLSVFSYNLDHVSQMEDEDLEKVPSIHKVETYVNRIMMKMKLTNEVCLLALIFIERLMVSLCSVI